MARKLEIEIVGDASHLNRQLNQAGSGLSKFGKAGVVAAGAAGIGALFYTIKTGIGEFAEAQKVTAQTNAVIKSTGKVAHVSAKDVDELAESLMKKSGVDDEAIASGENMLLTFTNIRNEVGKGKDIFNQATKATLDLSVATGKDMASASVLVGKALNDPAKGLTALTRVGVSFTDGQKKQIKAMQEAGDTAGAQKIILKELNREFGGSAEAAGKTLPGQLNIAKQTFANLTGELVAKTIPILQQAIGWLKDHWPEIKAAIKSMWDAVKPVLQSFGEYAGTVVGLWQKHWGTIKPILMTVLNLVKNVLRQIKNVIDLFTAILKGDWSAAWDAIKNMVRVAWDQIKTLFTLAKQTLGAAMLKLLVFLKDKAIEGLKALPGAMWDLLKWVGGMWIKGIKAGIELEWKLLKAALGALFHKAIDWVKDVLGINSPSTVFHDIGVNMIKGMVNGVGSMGGYLKDAVIKLAKSIPSKLVHGIGLGSGDSKGLKDQVWKAIVYAREHGWGGEITSGFRSYAEQSALYQRYLAGGPLAAKPGTSSHYERGEAVDVTDYGTFARIMSSAPPGKRLYNYLGARDPVHFSVSGYAKGGIFNRPTLGVIGEAGPEAVIPLSRGGGRPQQVNLVVDGRTLASVLIDPLRNQVKLLEARGGAF